MTAIGDRQVGRVDRRTVIAAAVAGAAGAAIPLTYWRPGGLPSTKVDTGYNSWFTHAQISVYMISL